MNQLFIKLVLAIGTCSHDEPGSPFKPLEERRVLVLNYDGEIYDQHGEMVMQLPNCTYATEIISDGDDYFVSGVQSKDRVGYWKNGKWNTLHVDFIDDVDHWKECTRPGCYEMIQYGTHSWISGTGRCRQVSAVGNGHSL